MVSINKISKSLKYVGKQLFINNVDCESIIKIHKTPIYCYSSSEIIQNYNNFHINFQDYSNDPISIFIVGLPRCGSTLVE